MQVYHPLFLFKKHYQIEKIVFAAFLFLLFLFPPVEICGLSFSVRYTDIFLPVLLFFVIKNRWYVDVKKPLVLVLLLCCFYIVFTMAINCRLSVINDYFELYDILKIIICGIFFKNVYTRHFTCTLFDIIFILLLIFNIFHYYNIGGFNEKIMPYYAEGNLNLIFFGRNSLGEVATKRMLGTMGNPNNNALLFLFFLVLYAPRKQWNTKDVVFFFLALTAFLMCQSRTGLIVGGIVLLLNFSLSKISIKMMAIEASAIILLSCIVLNSNIIAQYLNIQRTPDDSYLLTLFNDQAFESNSWKKRVDTWQNLSAMWKEKPLFGHSPNKNYFYDNKIYSENEYILMLWRYGIIGLIFYLLFYFIPIRKAYKYARSDPEAKNVVLLGAGFLVAALTNAPLQETTLVVIYSMTVAFFYALLQEKTHINSKM